jgi:drug/metabolite transporter (DMT)-like permease
MKKPFIPFSDSGGTSSLEISDKSDSEHIEKELFNFINENREGPWQRFKKIPAFGIILGIMSVVAQLGMFTNVKILYNTTTMTPFEIIYLRGVTDLVLCTTLCKFLGVDFLGIEQDHRKAIRIRMFFAAASAFFVFMTFKVNPISLATTLTFTSPIFTSIFTFFAIGERITRYDIANIC